MARWTIDQLRPEGRSRNVAIRWLAALDDSLHGIGINPEPYWRFHACTLLLRLERRLAVGEEAAMAELPGWIGEHNLRALAPMFAAVKAAEEVWPSLIALTELAFSGEAPLERRWALLREITHSTLKQLSLPVGLHIPLVLYAWGRSLGRLPLTWPDAPSLALTEEASA